MRVGIDAHKMKCTTVMFDGDSVTGSFDFQTTRHGVYEFMEKVPEGSIAVIESSTTGIRAMLYDGNMPEGERIKTIDLLISNQQIKNILLSPDF